MNDTTTIKTQELVKLMKLALVFLELEGDANDWYNVREYLDLEDKDIEKLRKSWQQFVDIEA